MENFPWLTRLFDAFIHQISKAKRKLSFIYKYHQFRKNKVNLEYKKSEISIEELDQCLNKLNLYYEATDVKILHRYMQCLLKYNLDTLISGLLSCNKAIKFLEKLTEVKFAIQLIESIPVKAKFKILYEPPFTKRPIDFYIHFKNKKYFIQVKSLLSSIRESLQQQTINEIRRQELNIPIKRIFNLHVKNLYKNEVTALMNFIKNNSDKKNEQEFEYVNGKTKVVIYFEDPKNINIENLTLRGFGDLEAVDITNMTKYQVKDSLRNAADAFEFNTDKSNFNLIVCEIKSDRSQGIDFAEAVYGSEYSYYSNRSKSVIRARENDGLFLDDSFKKKITAIIILHRKEDALSSLYEKVICINPQLNDISFVTDLIHDKIIERFTGIYNGFFS